MYRSSLSIQILMQIQIQLILKKTFLSCKCSDTNNANKLHEQMVLGAKQKVVQRFIHVNKQKCTRYA